ncbi:MAG TPA: amidohydrolase family protein, partial [Terracidiphilus sp.]
MTLNRRLTTAAALALLMFVFPAASTAQAKRTLVRAGHLLDVKTGKIADAQTIVVVGDTIQSIGATAQTPAQPGDTVIDLGGMTVLPGLIDVHTHLTMST